MLVLLNVYSSTELKKDRNIYVLDDITVGYTHVIVGTFDMQNTQ